MTNPTVTVPTATAPAIAATGQPVIVDDTTQRRDRAVARVLNDEPRIVEGDQLEQWDSGSLADYLERKGLMNGSGQEQARASISTRMVSSSMRVELRSWGARGAPHPGHPKACFPDMGAPGNRRSGHRGASFLQPFASGALVLPAAGYLARKPGFVMSVWQKLGSFVGSFSQRTRHCRFAGECARP